MEPMAITVSTTVAVTDDSDCNIQTGHCEGGCKPGFTNTLCTERE